MPLTSIESTLGVLAASRSAVMNVSLLFKVDFRIKQGERATMGAVLPQLIQVGKRPALSVENVANRRTGMLFCC